MKTGIQTYKVRIERCSGPFLWYANIMANRPKVETAESMAQRTFICELDAAGEYRTVVDVAGPGVKGFIQEQDSVVIPDKMPIKEARPGEVRSFEGKRYRCFWPGNRLEGGIWSEVEGGAMVADYKLCCQLDQYGESVED